MKVNKMTLIHAARTSCSVEEVVAKLGKDPEQEEKIWEKMLRLVPGVEDFLERNEVLTSMKIAKADGDEVAFKEARAEYIALTMKLIDNGLITDKSIMVKPLGIKTASNRRGLLRDPLNDSDEGYIESEAVDITSNVPQYILDAIISKNK